MIPIPNTYCCRCGAWTLGYASLCPSCKDKDEKEKKETAAGRVSWSEKSFFSFFAAVSFCHMALTVIL